MKKTKVIILVVVMIVIAVPKIFSQQQIADHKKGTDIQFDRYGHIIKEGNERFEFEAVDLLEKQDDENGLLRTLKNPIKVNTINCNPNWEQAVMGTCIGLNSMNSADFDNDGKTEIICSGGSGFGGGHYWYILEYNPVSTEYEFSWVSDYYEGGWDSPSISVITYFDLGNDGHLEICCGMTDGSLLIYDGETMDLLQSIDSDAETVNKVFLADADNDNNKEIVFCDEENTYLYNATSFALEYVLEYGAHDFEPGNVNSDPKIQLVYSNGNVICFDQGITNSVWNFAEGTSYEGFIELSDIDNDGMDEIIFSQYWHYITVYDVDLQSPKYEIETDLDIDALLLIDTDSDGTEEILYGDGQWGDIYCYNAETAQLIWNIPNPEHGTTEINVADSDNDGQLEVMWGAGCSSTGSDHLFIHEIPSCNFEYKTKHIDPPFYSIEIGDVDDDGTQEIVTLSYESNSGYDSGIMTIINSEDHSIEWQSDEEFFYLVWTGMYDMEIEDIDQDGETEIIVAAGRTYTGQLWIMNGSTHEIESNHIFSSEGLDEFYALDVADVDNDGQIECIVSENHYVHVIDPTDFSIEWSSVNLQGSYIPGALYVDNVDSDANQEIIFCNEYIYIIDGTTHQQWQTTGSSYKNIDIYDINNDGVNDIVACTSTGLITAIDGQTHQTSILVTLENMEPDGIRVDDITGDGEFDYIYTSGGAIYFRTQSGQEMNTQPYGLFAGKYDGLKISDYDGDGWKEVLAGTNYLVIELGNNCYNCLDFDIEVHGEDVSCMPGNDGSVEVTATGGEAPYYYAWSFGGTNSIETGLQEGTYSVSVTDNQGCEKTGEVTIVQSQLITEVNTKKVGCAGLNDGTAEVEIIEGHPPYQFTWNNGSNSQQITGLSVGNYNVTITDDENCTASHNITIAKDTLIYQVFTQDIECNGFQNGFASIEMVEGEPPFSFEWSNGHTGASSNSLPPGNYTVTITDDLSCSSTTGFGIAEPSEILITHTTTPDDPSTPEGEGSATLQVTGGTPPYYYLWYDPLNQTNQTAINLESGEYLVQVTDINQCMQLQVLFVPDINAVNENDLVKYIQVHPNPATEHLVLECTFNKPESLAVSLVHASGVEVIKNNYKNVTVREIQFDVSNFSRGLYILKIQAHGITGTWKVNLN